MKQKTYLEMVQVEHLICGSPWYARLCFEEWHCEHAESGP